MTAKCAWAGASSLNKLMIVESAPELLECDLKLELLRQQPVNDGIYTSETARDDVSREPFQTILDDTEEHIEWIETQLELINKVGLQNHLQSQMET